MMQRSTGGIASAMNDARATGGQQPARPGEGVTDTAELARIIALVKQAEAASSKGPPDMMVGEFIVAGGRVPVSYIPGLQALTRTEAAVLRFLGWGRANNDIASMLDINENTVRTHMGNAVTKLGVDGARELIGLAGLLFHPLD
jgi:DNA-binding NarL/FixJ family response regulator